MQTLLKFGWLPVLLCACVGGNTTQDTTNTVASAKSGSMQSIKSAIGPNVFTIGGTYDSMSNHPTITPTCLIIGNNPKYLQVLNPNALLTLDSVADYHAVQNALGIEYTARFGWGAFSTTVSYQYARSSRDDNYTYNLNYAYQYAGKAVLNPDYLGFGNKVLTSSAAGIIESNPVGFRQMCGDNFVSGANAGLSLLMRVSLQFSSHSEKNRFDASFKAESGLSSVLATIKNQSSGTNYSLTISGIQVGGNPKLLLDLFQSYPGGGIGADGYPQLSCGSGININPDCTLLINKVVDYAKTLPDQLKTVDDYYLSNPIIEPWSNLMVYPGVVDPESSTLKAMEDLALQYPKDQDNLTFLTNYYTMLGSFGLRSDTMRSDLEHLISAYKQVLSIYLSPASNIMNCYNGYVSSSCISIRDNIFSQRSQILNDNNLNQLLDYLKANQYSSDLLVGKDSYGAINSMECSIAPISNESLSEYFINCGGQVSGSLDPNKSIIIKHDRISNLMDVSNFSYSYRPESSSRALNFSYLVTKSLVPENYYTNVWGDYEVPILVNSKDYGVGELVLVNYFQ